MMKIFILFVLQFFYIVFHVLYTDATCLNGYVYIYIKGRSKSLIYLKSGEKCKKTRPIYALRNHFLVLQFFAIFSFASFAIVFHIFYTGTTCINEYVCRHTYSFNMSLQCKMYKKLCKKMEKLKNDFSRCGWV